jgi:hypothetical protein
MKRFAASLLSAVAIAATFAVAGLAAPPSVTGTWTIQQSGLNGSSTSQITLTQSGNGTATSTKEKLCVCFQQP